MSGDQFKTPLNKVRSDGPSLRSTAMKRDSLVAELERDPQLSTAKRQQRAQVFTSSVSHASLERQLLAAQTAKLELETKLREKELLVERLERDRRWFADREKEEREEKESERAAHEEAKVADLKDAHEALSRSTNQTTASQKSQITTLTHQNSLLQDELDQESAIEDLQAQYDELSAGNEAITRRVADEESMAVVREELHPYSELNSLRERHTRKAGIGTQSPDARRTRTKVVKLEAEVEAGRKEREEWSADTKPSDTPISVTQTLSDLRLVHARLLEDHGATSALLRQRETELADVERREAQAQETIASLEQNLRIARDKREVMFLQALVASFNAEEAHMEDSHIDNAKVEQIRQLEKVLQEYKRKRTAYQELDALVGGSSSLVQGRNLQNAEVEMKQNLDKIEELEQTLFELRGEIAGGRHVPPGVRILSMADNPEQQWFDLRQAAMDRLKGENEALMKRLKELEESGAHAATQDHGEELVPRQSWELVNREKLELQDVVKQKEKRLLRLQQVFTSKSAEFREAIASILGLKLAFYPNGQIRVTSVYDLCASFGARMQLVAQGEGGPQDLPNLMQYWIEKEQCIPGFLASVTLECYDKSKRENAAI
ncbi:spindle assembly checkpoint component Mad1 [Flammula alnicola]|nr:spindle assembly checkpoint component Mad1 [Flammula alnicola]